MTIKPPPIQENVLGAGGRFTNIWTLWLQTLRNRANEGEGVSGTFTTADAKTVTVVNGIITGIV